MGVSTLLIFAAVSARTNVRAESVDHPALTPTRTPMPSPSATPTAEATATPTPTIYPTATATPTPSPIPETIPTASSQQINGFIDKYSGQYGVDPNALRHTALCESGFNPDATNGPYAGLFQFDTRTWQIYRNLMGKDPSSALRWNAEDAAQTAAYVYSIGASSIWPNCRVH